MPASNPEQELFCPSAEAGVAPRAGNSLPTLSAVERGGSAGRTGSPYFMLIVLTPEPPAEPPEQYELVPKSSSQYTVLHPMAECHSLTRSAPAALRILTWDDTKLFIKQKLTCGTRLCLYTSVMPALGRQKQAELSASRAMEDIQGYIVRLCLKQKSNGFSLLMK